MLILSEIPAAIHSRRPPRLRIAFTHELPSSWSPGANHHQKLPKVALVSRPSSPTAEFPGGRGRVEVRVRVVVPDLGCIRFSWALRMLILSEISAAIHSRCPPRPRIAFTHESPCFWSPDSNHHQSAAPDWTGERIPGLILAVFGPPGCCVSSFCPRGC